MPSVRELQRSIEQYQLSCKSIANTITNFNRATEAASTPMTSRRTSSRRKLTKRKLPGANPPGIDGSTPKNGHSSTSTTADTVLANSNVGNFSSTNTGLSGAESCSRPPVSQSHAAGNLYKFRAQATNSDIEVDSAVAANTTLPITSSGDREKTDPFSSNKNTEHMPTNPDLVLTPDERHRISSAAYVTNLTEEDILAVVMNLKRQGLSLTQDILLDECMKIEAKIPDRAKLRPSFPKVTRDHDSISATQEVTTDGSTFNSLPEEVPTQLRNPTVPSQNSVLNTSELAYSTDNQSLNSAASIHTVSSGEQSSTSLDNAAQAEDFVDGPLLGTALGNQEGKSTMLTSANAKNSGKDSSVPSKTNSSSSESSWEDPPKPASFTVPEKTVNQAAQPLPDHAPPRTSQDPVKDSPLGAYQTIDSNNSKGDLESAVGPNHSVQNDLNKETNNREHRKDIVQQKSDKDVKHDPIKLLKTNLKLVRKEYRLLDAARHCGECGHRPRDITFLPCGHVWACRSCAVPLYVCPCCGKSIIATVDTYLC